MSEKYKRPSQEVYPRTTSFQVLAPLARGASQRMPWSPIMPETTALTHFNKARKELALATDIDEVKEIRDKAEALRAYAKQQGESLGMQNDCAEFRIRCEVRIGEVNISVIDQQDTF